MEEIIFTDNIVIELGILLKNYLPENVFVLCDDNTLKSCFQIVSGSFKNYPRICSISQGDNNKNLQTAEKIWKFLLNNNANRDSLLINLGGGVVTDIGGFVASTFKRGIDFINIPTSLMSMSDASIGGKNAINLDGYKNQLGLYSYPKKLIIDTIFLNTLPKKELVSGFSEIVKHSVLISEKSWKKIKRIDPENIDFEYLNILVKESVLFKKSIVEQDFKETGIRESLNFGHTVGHAIETYFLNKNIDILHGEAVAIGMIAELFLSNRVLSMEFEKLFEITEYLATFFPSYKIPYEDYEILYEIMKKDKKNKNGEIKFSLLQDFGEIRINQTCTKEDFFESLNFYYQVKK